MVQFFASVLFAASFFGSIAVIALMMRAYRHQALAALRWKPADASVEPLAPVYHIRAHRRRVVARPVTLSVRPAPYRVAA